MQKQLGEAEAAAVQLSKKEYIDAARGGGLWKGRSPELALLLTVLERFLCGWLWLVAWPVLARLRWGVGMRVAWPTSVFICYLGV